MVALHGCKNDVEECGIVHKYVSFLIGRLTHEVSCIAWEAFFLVVVSVDRLSNLCAVARVVVLTSCQRIVNLTRHLCSKKLLELLFINFLLSRDAGFQTHDLGLMLMRQSIHTFAILFLQTEHVGRRDVHKEAVDCFDDGRLNARRLFL